VLPGSVVVGLIFLAIVDVLLWVGLYECFKTGTFSRYGKIVRRDNEPLQYWVCVGCTGFGAVACIVFGIVGVVLVLRAN
jgi:hypothetical protein